MYKLGRETSKGESSEAEVQAGECLGSQEESVSVSHHLAQVLLRQSAKRKGLAFEFSTWTLCTWVRTVSMIQLIVEWVDQGEQGRR